jgi:hypothetical protein
MEATDGTSRRGRRAFNDSLAPVDFSFSTYIRPFKAAGDHAGTADGTGTDVHAVEEALWALFSGPAVYDNSAGDHLFTDQTVPGSVISTLSFDQSNTSTLGPDAGANLYFELGDANKICYKLSKVAINEASIDFDIDGVAQINWTGFADTITDISKTVVTNGAVASTALIVDGTALVAGDAKRRIHGTGMTSDVYLDTYLTALTGTLSVTQTIDNDITLTLLGPRATIYEGIDQTNNFIRNRLTKCIIVVNSDPAVGAPLEDAYTLTLTGGNITLSNNITYLTPEELGTVNIPIGHVTGARAFGGSMTCYLTETTDDTISSRDFFEDLTSTEQRSETTNDFSLEFLIGGGTVTNPGTATAACSATGMATTSLAVAFPSCHVSIPTHSIEDVITLETTFMALPSTIGGADEVTMRYKGPAKA